MLKEKKYILLMFQNVAKSRKTSYYFDYSKRRNMTLSCSKKTICIFKNNSVLNCIKESVKIKIFVTL